mgnify:FL=1
MNNKLLSIASIIFAIIFVAIFMVVWGNTRDIIQTEANEMDALYASKYDFDIATFNDRVVSNDTLVNLAYNIADSGYSQSVKLKFYEDNGGSQVLIGNDATYNNYSAVPNELMSALERIDSDGNDQVRVTLTATNENGVIDGLLIMNDT